jgi:branched-chain amino acid transport system ATP-binding protein
MVDSNTILEMSNLRKTFGGLVAVDSVGFAVQRGSITGLIGPNGSGKSTLFNLIAGTMKADSGSVHFEGEKIDGLSADKRFHRGMVRSFQDPKLFFGMNVFENMLVPPAKQKGEGPTAGILPMRWKAQEIELGKKAKEVMTDLKIYPIARNNADEISGGQMKLLQLGQTLMNSPKLILLDEPTAGVAPALTIQIFDKIKELRERLGITFLVIEHKLQVLFKYVDYVQVMHRGKIFASGTPEQVISNPELANIYL